MTNKNAHISFANLSRYNDGLKKVLDNKVDKAAGKRLLDDAEGEKLASVGAGAQANIIESVSIKGENIVLLQDKEAVIDLGAYVKKADVASVLKYKGTKNTYAELPAANELGDVWNVATADKERKIKAGDNVAWNGSDWDVLAGAEDLSGYVAKEDGKGFSSNDYTTEEKNKLANIEFASDDDIDGLFF